MNPYIHKVQYYETDKMGIVHHSNYVRWMEEARVNFLEEIGCGYDKLEEMGVISPVIAVSCQYKRPCYFADEVEITVSLKEYTGIKFVYAYEMRNLTRDTVCAAATSEHCITNENGRPVSIKRSFPSLHETMESLLLEPKE